VKRPYDRSFDPPAPALPIVVRRRDGRPMRLVAKLDTAADVCGMPSKQLADLGFPPARRIRTLTFRGEPMEAVLHRGDVEVAGRRLSQVEWLPIGRPYALLGRSVLNQLVVRLDGPALTTTLGRR
jgi:hypothetical protein